MRKKRSSQTGSCFGFLFLLPFFPFILIFEFLKRFPKLRAPSLALFSFLIGITAASESIQSNQLDSSFVLALLLILAPSIYFGIKVFKFFKASGFFKSRQRPRFVSCTIDQIDAMSGLEFEEYTASLLRQLGYSGVEVTKSSGDQGIDVLAQKDGKKYAIQCKNYIGKLGNAPVQEAFAGMVYYGCDIAVVLTNSTFTNGAQELAQATGVLLWDRNTLCEMIRQADRRPLQNSAALTDLSSDTNDSPISECSVTESTFDIPSNSTAKPVAQNSHNKKIHKTADVDPAFIAAAQWYAARGGADLVDDE